MFQKEQNLFESAVFQCFLIVFNLPSHPPCKADETNGNEDLIRAEIVIGPFEASEILVEGMPYFPPESCMFHNIDRLGTVPKVTIIGKHETDIARTCHPSRLTFNFTP